MQKQFGRTQTQVGWGFWLLWALAGALGWPVALAVVWLFGVGEAMEVEGFSFLL